jgi:hypothetical protein
MGERISKTSGIGINSRSMESIVGMVYLSPVTIKGEARAAVRSLATEHPNLVPSTVAYLLATIGARMLGFPEDVAKPLLTEISAEVNRDGETPDSEDFVVNCVAASVENFKIYALNLKNDIISRTNHQVSPVMQGKVGLIRLATLGGKSIGILPAETINTLTKVAEKDFLL